MVQTHPIMTTDNWELPVLSSDGQLQVFTHRVKIVD